jgi:hypothetical protein
MYIARNQFITSKQKQVCGAVISLLRAFVDLQHYQGGDRFIVVEIPS